MNELMKDVLGKMGHQIKCHKDQWEKNHYFHI